MDTIEPACFALSWRTITFEILYETNFGSMILELSRSDYSYKTYKQQASYYFLNISKTKLKIVFTLNFNNVLMHKTSKQFSTWFEKLTLVRKS